MVEKEAISSQIKEINSFKYVGVIVYRDLTNYVRDNLEQLFLRYKTNIILWSRLPLSLAGRCNLVKMILFPQIL